MKKIIIMLWAVLIPVIASAEAVEIDGIYYNLTTNTKQAEVTSRPSGFYSGVVNIPSTVEYENVVYDVTAIGYSAFLNCSSLTSVTIPNSVTTIGNQAFLRCTGLTSVTIGNSVTSIGSSAFFRCTGLTSVTIPNSVTSLGISAFLGCTGLTSITIPNSVTSIGGSAFEECSGLTSITIPNSVTSIDLDAFKGCSGLTSIKVESGNTKFDSRDNCNAIIETTSNKLIVGCKNTTIPNSVTTIGYYAFWGCSGLTSVTIPNSVTSIYLGAFEDCTGLTSVTIGNSVTSIGKYAFSGCSGLTSVTIGSSVKNIYSQAFANCKKLETVYCHAEAVPNTDNNAFYSTPINEATLHVPASSLSDYQSSAPWSDFGTFSSTHESYTLNSLGMGTYCSENDLDFTNVSGIKAYIACGFNPTTGVVFIMHVNEVPANTGVMIKGTPGTYSIPVKDTDMYYVNMFKGTLVGMTVPATENGYKNYVLRTGDLGPEPRFYESHGSSTLAANRAYLQLPSSVYSAREFVEFCENDVTGVTNINCDSNKDDSTVFNLNGQRVTATKKGLYIINGKKVFVR